MNFKPRNLGVITLILFLYSCSSSGSSDSTTSQDTITKQEATTVTNPVESVPVPVSVIEEPALENYQADDSTVIGKFNIQFENLSKGIVDSNSSIKVLLQDNYNEYEGQDEHWDIEMYFDNTFSLRFYREIYETGVVGSSEIKEYVIDHDTIVWGRERKPYYKSDYGGKTIIQWDNQSGVNKIESEFVKTTNETLPDAYKLERFKKVKSHLSTITKLLKNSPISDENENSYTVAKGETKEANDLIDSTKVIVPKIIYKHLKNMN